MLVYIGLFCIVEKEVFFLGRCSFVSGYVIWIVGMGWILVLFVFLFEYFCLGLCFCFELEGMNMIDDVEI